MFDKVIKHDIIVKRSGTFGFIFFDREFEVVSIVRGFEFEMIDNFWRDLPRPFFVLAPMEDVTDVVFRHVISEAG